MKSLHQVLSLLRHYSPASPIDAEFIEAFINKTYPTAQKPFTNASESPKPLIDVQSFIQWLQNGLGCLQIASYDTSTVLIGDCNLTDTSILAILSDSGELSFPGGTIPQTDLQNATDAKYEALRGVLLANGLEPDPTTLELRPKFIPQANNYIVYSNWEMSVQGVGVIRSIDPEADTVELYCYYEYPSPSHSSRVGCSMHENGIVNLSSYCFTSIIRDNQPTILGNSTSCIRRMNNEMASKFGKVWKDKLHRIEPVDYRAEGSCYWYINDKLKVVKSTDKDTCASRQRYYAGNYFTTNMAALKMSAKLRSVINDYLASEQWPMLDDNE